MDVTQVLNARFDCARCHAQGSWASSARPMRRQNSVIHHLRCTRCGEQIVAKASRETNACDNEARTHARKEYETLCTLQSAFPQGDRYGTLVPLGYLEAAGREIVITRLFQGHDLVRYMRTLDTSGIEEACQSAGEWLRKLHDCGRQMAPRPFGTADRLAYLASTYDAVLSRDPRTCRAWNLLVREAPSVDSLVAPAVRLHGDFKPGNMLCDGARYVGLDIHWGNLGPAVYDLAPFLNHLWLAGYAAGRSAGRGSQDLAEAKFMTGYGGAKDAGALRWVQLYFALCYMGGYRKRGWLAARYANWRVRPLALHRARQLMDLVSGGDGRGAALQHD